MRKMLSCTYKRWNKMWKLWKRHKLNSPLEEFIMAEMNTGINIIKKVIEEINKIIKDIKNP